MAENDSPAEQNEPSDDAGSAAATAIEQADATGVEQAEQAVEEPEFEYPVTVEDVGPGEKRIVVEVPRVRIDEKIKAEFKDLRRQAVIPGFRSGHAPQRLVEKRFASDVKDQVRRALITESYEQALEKHSLRVIGEPQFNDPESIQIPEEGSMTYSFQVEIQPEFELPHMTGLSVQRPKIDIREQNIDQAMNNLREQQGAMIPVEDRGVETGDYLIGDVSARCEGETIAEQKDAQLVARPGRIAGLQIDDFDQRVAGLRAGETRSFTISAPADYAHEASRGKEVEVSVALKDLKRLELAEVTPAFLEDLGFASEQELRDALREQMQEKIDADVNASMRDQVRGFLLNNVTMELPARLSEKQTARVINRRAMRLQMRGVPSEAIRANIETLAAGATDEAARELKLFFILQKVADANDIDVTEQELNGQIANLSMQSGQRPEKLKQDMAKDGTLASLYVEMRENKAIDHLLGAASVVEVSMTGEGAVPGAMGLAPMTTFLNEPSAAEGEAPAAEGQAPATSGEASAPSGEAAEKSESAAPSEGSSAKNG